MEWVPDELQRPLWDEVRPHVESLVERFIQVPASSGEDDSDAEVAGGVGGDRDSSL